MKWIGYLAIALLCSFVAFWVSAAVGTLFLILFHMSVHGYGAGVVIVAAAVIAIGIFTGIIKKLNSSRQ